MQKIDLHVVSIPSHEAQLEIARIIVSKNHATSLQTAIEMAKNPPILLFHNIDVKDAKQYLNTFEKLGIAFKVSKEEIVPEAQDAVPAPDVPQESAAADQGRQVIDAPQESADTGQGQGAPDDSPTQAGADQDHHISSDSDMSTDADQGRRVHDGSLESAGTDQTRQAAADPQSDGGDAMSEFAGIRAHNSTIDRGAAEETPPARSGHIDHPELADHNSHHDHTAHPLHTPMYAGPVEDAHTHGHGKPIVTGPAGSAHGRPIASGIRVGEIGLDKLAKIELESRKKSLMITALAVGVILVFGLIVLVLPKNNKFSMSKSDALIKKVKTSDASKPGQDDASTQSAQSVAAPAAASAQQNGDMRRDEVNSRQKQQANAFVDSAKARTGDKDACIAFYKIAISFNRYNLPAWQGLLQAYREQGRVGEANETLEQMTTIFGDQVMSVTALVKPFGNLLDAYMSGDGTYRVEYQTKKLAKDDVLREVFNMTRAVRSACSCRNISIYAATGAGRGLLAHSKKETSVHTLSAFSQQAEIVWLD